MKKIAIYIGKRSISSGTSADVADTLRAALERDGAAVTAILVEDGSRRGRGPQTAWGRLMADLDRVDQIVVPTVGDLPGWAAADVLRLLDTLRQAGVGLYCDAEGIGTEEGPTAILDLISAYRRAKLGQAIRRGQERARAAGRHIGRPPIPASLRRRVQAALDAGGAVRSTARQFGLSPASIINIRQMARQDHANRMAA